MTIEDARDIYNDPPGAATRYLAGKKVSSLEAETANSFCQDKIMTTSGDGGMHPTNTPGTWQWTRSDKEHGKDYSAAHVKVCSPEYRWFHDSIGTNFRMTVMQEVKVRIALGKLDTWIDICRRLATTLNRASSDMRGKWITLPTIHVGQVYYKYFAFVLPDILRKGGGRDDILTAIIAKGVPFFSGSCSGIYLEKAFVRAGLSPMVRSPFAC